VSEYVEYVYLTHLLGSEFDKSAGDQWIESGSMKTLFSEAMGDALRVYGYEIGGRYDYIVEAHWESMLQSEILAEEGDEFAGNYLKFAIDAKDQYIREFLVGNPIAKRMNILGEPALEKALANIATSESWLSGVPSEIPQDSKVIPLGSPGNSYAPASDRIVTLNHNQQANLDEAVEEVIDELKSENSVDGDSALRQRFLGELAAGKELIRAQSVRAYLLYETLSRLLLTLIDKYKDQALGEAAKKLLELLIESVFKK
jgi:hypothetical protein